jgi:hypothetical protein
VAASVSEFPNLPKLTAGLKSALSANGRVTGVLDREPALTASTFPSEIVTCRLNHGAQLRLYCKYAVGYNHDSHDHRRGLAYEATVYSKFLQPLQATAPKFYGVHTDPRTGETWLFLEYLDKSVPVNQMPDLTPLMAQAARWIGGFHAANEARLASAPMPFLVAYDADYYLGWARRTSRFAGRLHRRYPWLETVCRRFEELVDLLLSQPATVIHGEYESDNLLFRDGMIYPIDWEAAAIAVGEIDLARLTWGWPTEIVKKCEIEYRLARWPEGPPADFERTLAIARLYLPLRFLGDRPEWTIDESSSELFEELHSAGRQLGFI